MDGTWSSTTLGRAFLALLGEITHVKWQRDELDRRFQEADGVRCQAADHRLKRLFEEGELDPRGPQADTARAVYDRFYDQFCFS